MIATSKGWTIKDWLSKEKDPILDSNMKDTSSVEEFQRQVGLLQSLVRNDSETFSHFVVRVRDAANVLRAYILSTDNQQWAKVLFVAGLQVPIIGTTKGGGYFSFEVGM